MDLQFADGVVRAGGQARERFYDSRGYGRVVDGGDVELAPVEAAHLLYRGDVDSVGGMAFREFLASADCPALQFLVYADLRTRGFYLSPAREGWVDDPAGTDLVVYPRGEGPWDDAVAHRVRVVGERATLPAADLGGVTLAVVDEESEITYFETEWVDPTGTSGTDLPTGVPASLLADRVLVWDPPRPLYERAFYGQPLSGGDDPDTLQLSLVEAAHLAAAGVLGIEGGADAIRERGRDAEGGRFERRLRAYAELRERGLVPKTGFKFGADFRLYDDVESVSDLGHSRSLVRVLAPDHAFAPRDLALDVRLAAGVRKRMVFGLTGPETIDWLEVGRLTP
jgi:tRNA-intron endonuclease